MNLYRTCQIPVNSCVNIILCMIMGDGTNTYVITYFRILNKILFKSHTQIYMYVKLYIFPF